MFPSEPPREALAYQFLLEAAQEEGYSCKVLWEGEEAPFLVTEIRRADGMRMCFMRASSYPDHSRLAFTVAADKDLTQRLLQAEGLIFPQSYVISSLSELRAASGVFDSEGAWVLKPKDGSNGNGVCKVNSFEEALYIAEELLVEYGPVLLQSFVEGEDLRIQVVGGRLFAACQRIPANVLGDGEHSLSELIELKNVQKHERNQIVVPGGLDVTYVPEKEEQVFLQSVSNISLGGDPVDVTDAVHPYYHEVVEKVADLLSVKTFALDFVCEDPSKPGAVLLEVNVPCMWAHHHFALGQSRNVALAILDAHFDEQGYDPKNPRYLI